MHHTPVPPFQISGYRTIQRLGGCFQDLILISYKGCLNLHKWNTAFKQRILGHIKNLYTAFMKLIHRHSNWRRISSKEPGAGSSLGPPPLSLLFALSVLSANILSA